MAIIDKTYFIGEINIPTDNTVYTNKLQVYIDFAQSKYLQKALGYELYKAFIAELPTPISDRFTNLLNGVEFTNASGKLVRWTGLKNDEKESFLAYFAAYEYSINSQHTTTGNGQTGQKFENSMKVSPIEFQCQAYNLGIDHYNLLLEYLAANNDIYEEYYSDTIKKINWAGL